MADPIDDIIDKYNEQLFLHHNGVYFSLDGNFVYLQEPNGLTDIDSPNRAQKIDIQDIPNELSSLSQNLRSTFIAEYTYGTSALRESRLKELNENRGTNHTKALPYEVRTRVLEKINYIKNNTDLYNQTTTAIRNQLTDMGVLLSEDWTLSSLDKTSGLDIYMWRNLDDAIVNISKANQLTINLEHQTNPFGRSMILEAINKFPTLFEGVDPTDPEAFPHGIWRNAFYFGHNKIGAYDSTQHESYEAYMLELIDEGMAHMENDIKQKLEDITDAQTSNQLRINLENAKRLLADNIHNNNESQHLLENGLCIISDLDLLTGLRADGTFYNRDIDNVPTNQRAAGLASQHENRIIINSNSTERFREIFREEVSHITDSTIGQTATESTHYSHTLVKDYLTDSEDLRSDLYYLSTYWPEQIFDPPTEENNPILGGINDLILDLRHEITTPQQTEPNLETYLATELTSILTLSWSIYDDVRNTTDADINNSGKDTEVMVKFHRLRMRLEDWYAQNQGHEPDYYNTDAQSPILRLLGCAAPQITEIYRTGWLPAVNIHLNIESPHERELLLRAHMTQQEQEHGVISAQEQEQILLQLKEHQPSFEENENGDNELILKNPNNRSLSIPIKLQ